MVIEFWSEKEREIIAFTKLKVNKNLLTIEQEFRVSTQMNFMIVILQSVRNMKANRRGQALCVYSYYL